MHSRFQNPTRIRKAQYTETYTSQKDDWNGQVYLWI